MRRQRHLHLNGQFVNTYAGELLYVSGLQFRFIVNYQCLCSLNSTSYSTISWIIYFCKMPNALKSSATLALESNWRTGLALMISFTVIM